MRDGRLGHVVPARDVAGADRACQGKLSKDGQPDRIGCGLQEQDLGVGMALHPASVLTNVYLDKYQYTHTTNPRQEIPP